MHHIRQLAGESFIYGLAGAVNALIQVFLLPLYTHTFSKAELGVLEMVITTMNVLTLIAVLALDNSAHRWYWGSESDEDRQRTVSTWAWANFATTTLFAALIWLFAPWIAERVSGDAAHAQLYRIMSLTLPLGVLGLVTTGWLRMRRQPRLAITFTIGTSLLTVALVLLFVLVLKLGLIGVVYAQALAAVGITIAGALILGPAVALPRFDMHRLREMLHFALPLIPAALAAWVVAASGRYFVQVYQGSEQVAVYSVGLRIAVVAALVTTAFTTAWGPFALSIHQRPEAKEVYASALLWYLWATCTVAAALSLFCRYILDLVTPQGYEGALAVIGMLAFSYVMIGLKFVAGVGHTIVRDNRPLGLAVTVSGLIFIGLSLLLVPRYGLVGAALATLISQALIPVYIFWRGQQVYAIPYRFGAAAFIVIVAGAVSLAGHFVTTTGWGDALVRVGLLAIYASTGLLLRLSNSPQR
ncbi:MAG: oligosaccharide flippase family protein [bacterium]|nr:oligosaccharide flippase family protein [bacterium]